MLNQFTLIDAVSNTIYSPESIARGIDYAKTRGLKPDTFAFPWPVTDADPTPFYPFQQFHNTLVFTESLFIPILDITDPNGRQLVGFDIRYVGPDPNRLRYHKLKRTPTTHLMYGLVDALQQPHDFIIVTEGAIDAATFRQFGWPAISPLSSTLNERIISYYLSLAPMIFFAYDNDEAGEAAWNKLQLLAKDDPVTLASFRRLKFNGKDPNKALLSLGHDLFKRQIASQLPV